MSMFNRNTNESKPTRSTAAKASPPTPSLVSLVQGTHIEGTVEADGDIRVDGTIKGKLFCRAKVIVGPSVADPATFHIPRLLGVSRTALQPRQKKAIICRILRFYWGS